MFEAFWPLVSAIGRSNHSHSGLSGPNARTSITPVLITGAGKRASDFKTFPAAATAAEPEAGTIGGLNTQARTAVSGSLRFVVRGGN